MWIRKLINKPVINKAINITTKVNKRGSQISSQPIRNEQEQSTSQSHSTIDAADVDFFSNQLKEWWNPEGPMFLLHNMNLIRVPFVRDGLVPAGQKDLYPLKGKTVLDVGCGGGILSEGLARLGAQVTGIDASKELIRVAEEHRKCDPKTAENPPKYIYGTIEDHAITASNFYDGVVASEVIEHVHNQELFVKSCIQAVKPGGRLFFTTPNRTRLSQFVVIFLAENVLKAIPKGAHQFEKFVTPNELTFMLERNNCHVELTYGITCNPINRKFNFCQNQDLMYAIQAVKLS